MKSPYIILGIDEDADDTIVKQAYLQQVKCNPPDRDQARFQQIHQAFEILKDKHSRVKYALFDYPEADFDSLLEHAFTSEQTSAINADIFSQLVSASVNEKTFQQVISVLAERQIQQSQHLSL